MAERAVAIAGAGIAGLTAALTFAAKGFSVRIFEQAESLQEIGAGLQLSPNATRVLDRLGVLEALAKDTIQPEAILLKDAASVATLAHVPLGSEAIRRWNAPYLVAHRADLQKALLRQVNANPAITLELASEVLSTSFTAEGCSLTVLKAGACRNVECWLAVGADGVWSKLREQTGQQPSRFSGYAAFRAMVPAKAFKAIRSDSVSAFLAPRFHLVSYPVRAGREINLVLVTPSNEIGHGWANTADTSHLLEITRHAAPALCEVIRQTSAWTAWPIHEMRTDGQWTCGQGLALIGDAAHALSPYAAQGAAMAIEDAALLAEFADAQPQDLAGALSAFEGVRKSRLARVARRGRFNRFAWHAAGPVAIARNLALRAKSQQSLAADLDWLYGYDVAANAGSRSEKAI